MPDMVNVSYGNDSAGQHFTYAHTSTGEVDLEAKANLVAGAVQANVDSRIDRLPRQVSVDMLSGDGQGGIKYASSVTNGRLPDLSATADVSGVAAHPVHARFDAEGLPQQLEGEWSFPEGSPPSVHFAGSGQGIGAIEARIQNYTGDTTAFTPYVPTEQQYASIQAGPGGIFQDETLIQARIERIRGATIAGQADGSLVGQVNVGDGERALQVHGEMDLRPEGLPYINATAKISPLPDQINFSINPAGTDPIAEPTRIKYQPTESVDVDTEALVGLPGTSGALQCGDAGTACGSLHLRNIPAADFLTDPEHPTGGVEARLVNTATENRIEVDAVPRAGGAPMDVFGDATLGPIDIGGGPAQDLLAEPVYATFAVQGLPQHLRMRSFKDPNQDLKRFDVRTCDVDYSDSTCVPGTEDQVAEMTFDVRNFKLEDRAAVGVPAPPQSGPLYVTVTARGEDDPSQRVHFQVTGRMTSFKQLSYLGTGDLTGVKTDIGGNQDFRAYVDTKNVDVNGTDPGGRLNVDADVRIQHLPAPLTFCFAQNGRPLAVTPTDPITAKCENPDPFADGSVQKSPMTIAYDAGSPFDVVADVAVQGDFPFTQPTLPVDFGTFDRVAAHLALTNIPGQFTGYIQTPGESGVQNSDGTVASATRILTDAPGADNTRLELAASLTTAGVSCEDPNPNGGAVCANVVVDRLPPRASILAETVTKPGAAADGSDAVVSQSVQAHTCDYAFFDATPACRGGGESGIGEIKVNVRAHAGHGAENPVYQLPDGHYVFAQATIKDLADFEVEAGMRLLQLHSLAFHQDPEGLKVDTDLGDGVQPFTVHGYADLRDTTNLVPDTLKASVLADLVVAHLPQTLSISQTGPGQNQADPMVLTFDSSAETVVTANAEIRQAEADPSAACGDRGTVCAGLVIDDLPSHLDATIARTYTPIVEDQRDSDTRIFVNQTRFANPAKKLDITAHVALGLPADTPIVGEGPLVGDLLLQGIPDHISADMQSHEVIGSTVDQPDPHVTSSALERFQFQTCKRDYDSEVCTDGTGDPADATKPADQIDLVQVSVRTFDLRPNDFPTPPADHAPLYIGLTGRGTDVEGFVSIPEISEVQFLNRGGITGAMARVGGTTPSVANDLQIRADVQDLPLGNTLQVGDETIDHPTATLKAAVDITPFPGELSFCMRQGGISPMPAVSGIAFTASCENTQPFGASYGTPDHTPLSIGFHSNVPFDVGTNVDVAINGNKHGTSDPADQLRLTGSLSLTDVPADLHFHFLQPKVTQTIQGSQIVDVPHGPFHALIEAPGATSGLDLHFAAAYLVGPDTICKDPRPTVSATCVSGQIDNLPTKAELYYDPDRTLSDPSIDLSDPAQTQNLFVHTEGPTGTSIHDLEISTVQPRRDSSGNLVSPPKADALVATATLSQIPTPFDIKGTLDLPRQDGDAPTALFEVQDGNTLPGLKVHVQNFISPDPTAGAIVPARTPAGNGKTTYEESAILRGDAFRLDADIPGVRKAGIRAVRAQDHTAIGTYTLAVGFADDFNVRAYADLQPDPANRVLADLLIKDIPAEIDACLREPWDGAGTRPDPYVGVNGSTGTWCDNAGAAAPGETPIASSEGAIEVAQVPNTLDRKIDLDTFARLQFGGGSSVLSARVQVENVPQVIHVRLPGGGGTNVKVNAYSRSGSTLVADGIDKIQFHAATFDFAQADTPFTAALPYVPKTNSTTPFPVLPQPADGREFIHAAANIPESAFEVRGQLGRDDGQPSSQLDTFAFTSQPCTNPGHPDFPRTPTDDGTQYTCVYAHFADATDGVNPLSLHVEAVLPDGYVARLRDAGISDIPHYLQIQLAKAETFVDPTHQRGWRRPCGAASGPDADPGGDCMAPLLRFDQPDQSYLFGVAELAKATDLNVLQTTIPSRPAPDFNAVPDETSWGAFSGSDPQATGIRAKVVDFDGGTVSDFSDDRIAGRVSLRLQIPNSLTVDTPQAFKTDLQTPNGDGVPILGSKANDFRFHEAIRDNNGAVVDEIGELSAMVALHDTGAQALITQPCAGPVTAYNASDTNPPPCPEYTHGIEMPGEVGMTVYQRATASRTSRPRTARTASGPRR